MTKKYILERVTSELVNQNQTDNLSKYQLKRKVIISPGGENGASPTNGYPIASNPSDNNADTTDDVGSMDEDEWQEVGPKNRGAHTRKTVRLKQVLTHWVDCVLV